MRPWPLPIVLAAASAAVPANAQPRHAGRVALPKEPVETAPLADITLDIDAPTTRGTWIMRVSNSGDVPVRIVADARLLWLEVFPRGARGPVLCQLPENMRPDDDLERPLILPPHRAYSERFEPRLYCLGGKRLDALAPGSVVVAHLGWKGRTARFLEVSTVDGVEPKVAARSSVDARPIALPDEPTPPPVPASPDAMADVPRLSLRSSESLDAESASRIEIPVTLRNDGSRAVVLRFRPEMLRFDLVSQEKTERCSWPSLPGAPLRELFTTVPPNGTTSVNAVLGTYCSAHAFDQAGLYLVLAHLDTRGGSGTTLGLRTFDGELAATTPTVVRLHRGRAPRVLPHPRLQPPTAGAAPE